MHTRKKDAIDTNDEVVRGIYNQYSAYSFKKIVILILMVVILIVVSIFGMTVGSYSLSFTDVYQCIIDRILNPDAEMTLDMRVVWNQRMPRLLTGIIAGAGLGAAGAAMQSMMKNPLADPYTTGISSGASFGAILAITLGFSFGAAQYGVIALAFIFALVPAAVIVLMSTVKRATPSMMILAGIAVMYIFNALTQYMMIVADEQTLSAAYEWTIGTLNRASWSTLPIMAVVVIVGSVALWFLAGRLNAMNSGDEYAKTLGIDVDKARIIILVIISIITASIVSFTGVIGFVGLVAPHITRMFMGSDNKYLIPGSMLLGAIMVVLCDMISKLFTTTALPVGIITSLIGGPVFLFLILRQKKEVW